MKLNGSKVGLLVSNIKKTVSATRPPLFVAVTSKFIGLGNVEKIVFSPPVFSVKITLSISGIHSVES